MVRTNYSKMGKVIGGHKAKEVEQTSPNTVLRIHDRADIQAQDFLIYQSFSHGSTLGPFSHL